VLPLDKGVVLLLAVLGGLSFFPLDRPTSFSIDGTRDPRYDAIPATLGAWTGKETELDERTYEILETRNVLSRVYENSDGERIDLLVVGSNRDRRVAHPPEVCYLSSHYSISKTNDATLQVGTSSIPTKNFTAEDERNPDSKLSVLYFYKIGDRFTGNYYAQQLQFVWDRLRQQESEILLIRLSSSNPDHFRPFLTEILSFL